MLWSCRFVVSSRSLSHFDLAIAGISCTCNRAVKGRSVNTISFSLVSLPWYDQSTSPWQLNLQTTCYSHLSQYLVYEISISLSVDALHLLKMFCLICQSRCHKIVLLDTYHRLPFASVLKIVVVNSDLF